MSENKEKYERYYIQCDGHNSWSVWDKEDDFIVFDLFEDDAEKVCMHLNKLNDENEKLNNRVDTQHILLRNCDSRNELLHQENNQLKEENHMMKGVIYDMDSETYEQLFGDDDE